MMICVLTSGCQPVGSRPRQSNAVMGTKEPLSFSAWHQAALSAGLQSRPSGCRRLAPTSVGSCHIFYLRNSQVSSVLGILHPSASTKTTSSISLWGSHQAAGTNIQKG